MQEYKVRGGVGKSALTVQFVHDIFLERYDPTIEDSYKKNITIDGNQITVDILDTAGTDQFLGLHSVYVKSGHGFILVFSLDDINSMHEVEALRDPVLLLKEAEGIGKTIPMVLCGNKCDLEDRTVERSWAVNLSRDWGGVPYYETSAKTGINVDEAVVDLVRQLIKADRLGHLEPVTRKRLLKGRRSGRPCTIL
ncbi:P-loop containing nucleoside triphosphate hydrolase protein [Melampsora americana]|nr:P-loop containing nucleoside triphosphate hydrolase protein [Melampsora americana]